MHNFWTIYRREFSASFNSPIAYIFIFLFLAMMAFIFFVLQGFFARPNPEVRGYFDLLPWTLIIFIPAITMRLWSEEKKQGTIELLMTLPMKTWELVLGKFLAGYSIVAMSILLTLLLPITVSWVAQIDSTALVAAYVGALLIAGVYIAIGSWISALTENQIVAFLFAVVACALVFFMGFPQVSDWANKTPFGGLGRFVSYFGTSVHYQKFAQGQVTAVDVVYSLSMIGLFLGLNNFAVEGRKY